MFRKYKFEIYQDAMNEWRFRILAPNGRIVADGGEGYKTEAKCLKNINNLQKKLSTANVVYK